MFGRVSLQDYLEALGTERDRRYAEVAAARAEALKIKEEADKVALELARQIQTYKDQQHNGVLETLKERDATYATKVDVESLNERRETAVKALSDRFDIAHQPVVEFMAAQRGGQDRTVWFVGIILALTTILFGALVGMAGLIVVLVTK